MPIVFSSSWQGARSGPASDVCEFVYVWLCGRLFSQLELELVWQFAAGSRSMMYPRSMAA